MQNIIKVGIGVIIENDNKILLGHRCEVYEDTGGIHEGDTWTLPGGKQEYEETILECAKREVSEETNLDINDLLVLGASDDITSDRHFITIHVLAKSYSGILNVMESDKIDKWEWFDIDKLPSNLYSPSKKSIDIYLGARYEKY